MAAASWQQWKNSKLPYVCLALVSFVLFGLQILLPVLINFLFSQISTANVLPLVFLGFSSGIVAVLWLRERRCFFYGTYGLPFLLVAGFFLPYFSASDFSYFFLYSVSFFLAGTAIFSAIALLDSYGALAADLAGGALGLLCTLLLLPVVGAERLLGMLCCVGFVAATLLAWCQNKKFFTWLSLFSFLFCLTLVIKVGGWDLLKNTRALPSPEVRLSSPYLNARRALDQGLSDWQDGGWGLLGRVDLLQRKEGLRWDLYYNNARVSSVSEGPSQRNYLQIIPPGRSAFVVGVGGGGDISQLSSLGYKKIYGAEINEGALALLRKNFSSLAHSEINLHSFDGRSVLSQTDEKFDLLLFNYADLYVRGPFLDIYSMNYLYTKEAFTGFLRNLTTDGNILIAKTFHDGHLEATYRVLYSLLEAIREEKKDPAQHLAVVQYDIDLKTPFSRDIVFLLYSQQPLARGAVGNFLRKTIHHHKDSLQLVYPQQLGDLVAKGDFSREIQSLVEKNAVDGHGYRLSTDRWPYVYHVRYPKIFSEEPFRTLIVGALLLIFFSAGIFFKQDSRMRPNRRELLLFFLALALGCAYGWIEIGLVQSASPFLRSPLQAFVATVFPILLAGALGALMAKKVSWKLNFVLVILGVFYIWCLQLLLERVGYLLPLNYTTRFLIIVALVFPGALLLGTIFPKLIYLFGQESRLFRSFAMGVNSFGMVVATALGLFVSIYFDKNMVITFGVSAYALVIALLVKEKKLLLEV